MSVTIESGTVASEIDLNAIDLSGASNDQFADRDLRAELLANFADECFSWVFTTFDLPAREFP